MAETEIEAVLSQATGCQGLLAATGSEDRDIYLP